MTPIPSLICAVAAIAALPETAQAWGSEGHEIIADIAYSELAPAVRVKVDAMLAADTDPLTTHDIASEATWADRFRSAGNREAASWHFVDDELDHQDLTSACFGFPAQNHPASAGPPQDCVVDKITAFRAELASPSTSPAERLLALKFLLHFIGDATQPLHASDNHERAATAYRSASAARVPSTCTATGTPAWSRRSDQTRIPSPRVWKGRSPQ